MSQFLIILFIVISFSIVAQDENEKIIDDQIEMSEENVKLYDSLIKKSNFEFQFVELCKFKILKESKLRNWDLAQVEIIKDRIDFSYFKHNVLDGIFSHLSSEELSGMLEMITRLKDGNKYYSFYFFNNLIYMNIELYIEEICMIEK